MNLFIRVMVIGVMITLLNIAGATSIPVLMYHEIRSPDPHDSALRRDLSCSPAQFEAHLEWIAKQGYTTITSGQLASVSSNNKPMIMLTFDDGRESHYVAYELLKKYGLKGVFYVNTAVVGTPLHLSCQQLIEMDNAGMEIGSHTVTHRDLRTLSPRKLLDELTKSQAYLEQLLHHSVKSLAYPSGCYNQKIVVATKAAGYLSARTTRPGLFTRKDFFQIPVIRIHPTTTTRDLELILFPKRTR